MNFEHGLGFGGDGVIAFDVAGRARRIEFLAGVDDASSNATATARVTVLVDGRERWSELRRVGQSPAHAAIELGKANHVQVRIAAPTNIFSDIVLLRMQGAPGLREQLQQEREALLDYGRQATRVLSGPARLANGCVAFPVETPEDGACIGLSNGSICVVVAPARRGQIMVMPASASLAAVIARADVALQPAERCVARPGLAAADDLPWQWRLDSHGALRLLSPPDRVHGVRWQRTIYLLRGEPVVRVATACKNIMQHTISWSAGTILTAARGAQAWSEPAASRAVICTAADELWAIAENPVHGYFPYDGVRVRSVTNTVPQRVTLFSEITPLDPDASFTHVQYLLLAPRTGTLPDFERVAPAFMAVTNTVALAQAARKQRAP
jgi:hypothetical protein